MVFYPQLKFFSQVSVSDPALHPVAIKAFFVEDPQHHVPVGDFVNIQNPDTYTSFSGKVCSRLFNYIRIPDGEVYCGVNIVVEEIPDDKGVTP